MIISSSGGAISFTSLSMDRVEGLLLIFKAFIKSKTFFPGFKQIQGLNGCHLQ
jgi:hypothetical protein